MQLPNGAFMPFGAPWMMQPGLQMQQPAPVAVPAAAPASTFEAQRLRLASLVSAPPAFAAQPGQPVQVPLPATVSVSANGAEPITTIMLRNIPLKYTRETMLEDMNRRGFHGCYDFFYLPIDFQTHYSVGYAFINFINEAELARFKRVYQGMQLAADSAKVCEICPAKVQGKLRNIEVYRNSAVMGMEEEYHPAIFEGGVKGVFPKPTHPPKPFRPRPDRRA